jgi:hypothetical protein
LHSPLRLIETNIDQTLIRPGITNRPKPTDPLFLELNTYNASKEVRDLLTSKGISFSEIEGEFFFKKQLLGPILDLLASNPTLQLEVLRIWKEDQAESVA